VKSNEIGGLSFVSYQLGRALNTPTKVRQCSRGVILNVCCSSLEGNCHTSLYINILAVANHKGRRVLV